MQKKVKNQEVEEVLALAKPADLLRYIQQGANDLQAPAMATLPLIKTMLEDIAGLPGCQLARMSGSGATCFGLFPTWTLARQGADALARQRPDWWCVPTVLGTPLDQLVAENRVI